MTRESKYAATALTPADPRRSPWTAYSASSGYGLSLPWPYIAVERYGHAAMPMAFPESEGAILQWLVQTWFGVPDVFTPRGLWP